MEFGWPARAVSGEGVARVRGQVPHPADHDPVVTGEVLLFEIAVEVADRPLDER